MGLEISFILGDGMLGLFISGLCIWLLLYKYVFEIGVFSYSIIFILMGFKILRFKILRVIFMGVEILRVINVCMWYFFKIENIMKRLFLVFKFWVLILCYLFYRDFIYWVCKYWELLFYIVRVIY